MIMKRLKELLEKKIRSILKLSVTPKNKHQIKSNLQKGKILRLTILIHNSCRNIQIGGKKQPDKIWDV